MFGAQPRDLPPQLSTHQPVPQPQSQTSSQVHQPPVSGTKVSKSSATMCNPSLTLMGGVLPASSSAIAPNDKGHEARSDDQVDMVADTRERLHMLISVLVGHKEPSNKNGGASSQPDQPAVNPSRCKSSSALATTSVQPRAALEKYCRMMRRSVKLLPRLPQANEL